MACLVGVGRTLSKRRDEGLKAALKVAHMYPGSPQAWAVLVILMKLEAVLSDWATFCQLGLFF